MATQVTTNYFRRAIGIMICTAPLALLVTSIGYGLTQERVTPIAGIVFMGLSVVIGAFNWYLSFIRPRIYRLKQGSMDGYRNDSGIPIVGTIFVMVGGTNGFGSLPTALLGLIAVILDTGGLLWIPFYTWHDSSFWDE
jgi:hypothetical protein